MENVQDLFVSHAGEDKERYILPLTNALAAQRITFWLDTIEVGWGDSIALKINDGLLGSRFVLLCLSRNFIARPWPETELSAALAIQNNSGMKRVLPLILNAKDEVLARYPILAGMAYREYGADPLLLVNEVAQLVKSPKGPDDFVSVVIESAHTGKLCNLSVSPRVSVKWLSQKGQSGLGVSEYANTGGFVQFKLKWVLVDVNARKDWLALSRAEQRRMRAVVASNDGPRFSYSESDKLQDIGVYDGVVFHLHAVEDEDYYETQGGEEAAEEAATDPEEAATDPE